MTTERVIEAHRLGKRFGSKVAVDGLTLSLGRGEVFGLLGPNGAGKTTAVKMLLGLVSASAGSARVLGATMGDRPTRARIGFLPEHFRFQEWLTGRELLRFHGRLCGMRRPALETRADELLARVDLLDAADRKLGAYSKGMLQRVGLAQALLSEPELVFLDEPTSGLDPLGRRLVRDLIGELSGRGAAVFLSSHLLGEVEATCDRVAFVMEGRVVRELALADRSQELEVELEIGSTDPGVLTGLGRFGHDVALENGRVRLRVASESSLPELARWLVERDVPLYQMRSGPRSLEALFFEIMGEDQRPG